MRMMTLNKFSEFIWKLRFADDDNETYQDRAKIIAEECEKVIYEKAGIKLNGLLDWALREEKLFPAGRIINFFSKTRNTGFPYNCAGLVVEDDLDHIMQTAHEVAVLQKLGAGVGLNLSKLRPKGSKLKSGLGVASGPASFVQLYASIANIIQQGGGRRGGIIPHLKWDHPDIWDFINIKGLSSKLWYLKLKLRAKKDKRIMDDIIRNDIMKMVNMSVVFDREEDVTVENLQPFIEKALETGEPGLLFFHRQENWSLGVEPAEVVNLCGEVIGEAPLLCNLASINLKNISSLYELKDVTVAGVYLLTAVNYIMDIALRSPQEYRYPRASMILRKYPFLWNILEIQLELNRIGLGIMGYADWCIKNNESYEYAVTSLMRTILLTASQTSYELAKATGRYFDVSKSTFVRTHQLPTKLHHSRLLSIAPTGTISILGKCAPSWEPYPPFSQPKFVNVNGELQEIFLLDIPRDLTIEHVDPETRLKVQNSLQYYVDGSVANTLNLPESYGMAYYIAKMLTELKYIKGLTVFATEYTSNCEECKV